MTTETITSPASRPTEKAAICCIGHITLDRVITPEFDLYMPGGTAYYFAKALESLDHRDFRLVTAVGASEKGVAEELRREGIEVTVLPSRQSVFFENRYGKDRNERTQRVLAKADPFTIDSLRGMEANIFHLGTLLSDDFGLDVIKYLSERGAVSVDVQGYLRKVEGENVVHVDYADKREAMRYISVLKANEKEMEVLTGRRDAREAALELASWGCPEVVLTLGDRGSVICHEGEFHEIPAYKTREVVDTTGCGDTYMAGYLYKRAHGADCTSAGKFAAAMCTLKLEGKGPFSGSLTDIERLLAQTTL
ncbi:MAG: ribokinase [Bacteroidales bacterium]|nr:ribokinase [Bacteroidales bacterium]